MQWTYALNEISKTKYAKMQRQSPRAFLQKKQI